MRPSSLQVSSLVLASALPFIFFGLFVAAQNLQQVHWHAEVLDLWGLWPVVVELEITLPKVPPIRIQEFKQEEECMEAAFARKLAQEQEARNWLLLGGHCQRFWEIVPASTGCSGGTHAGASRGWKAKGTHTRDKIGTPKAKTGHGRSKNGKAEAKFEEIAEELRQARQIHQDLLMQIQEAKKEIVGTDMGEMQGQLAMAEAGASGMKEVADTVRAGFVLGKDPTAVLQEIATIILNQPGNQETEADICTEEGDMEATPEHEAYPELSQACLSVKRRMTGKTTRITSAEVTGGDHATPASAAPRSPRPEQTPPQSEAPPQECQQTSLFKYFQHCERMEAARSMRSPARMDPY